MPQTLLAIPAAISLLEANVFLDVATIGANLGLSATVTGIVATTAGTLAGAAVTDGVPLAVSAGFAALTAPSLPKPQALAFPLRTSTPVRQSGYGRAKFSGKYVLYDTASDGTDVDVIALHDGLIDGFETFYLNDDRVGVSTPNGWVMPIDRPDGRYSALEGQLSDKIAISTRLGLATETAYSTIAGATLPGWSAAHRGDGIASICLGYRTPKEAYYQTIYPNGEPFPSVVARLQLVWDPRDGTQSRTDPTTWKWSSNPVLCLLHFLLFAPNGVGLDYAFRIAPTLSLWIAAANDCDTLVPILNVASQLTANIDVDSTSINTISLYSVDGLEDGTSITVAANLGTSETFNVTAISGLNVTLSGNLANDHYPDELVEWVSNSATPATAPKYSCGGVYLHTTAPGDVIKTLLGTFDGFMGPRGDGALNIYSGSYYAPTVTITPDWIVGDSVQHYVEDEKAANVINVKFIYPALNYTTAEAEQWLEQDDIDARGVQRPSDLTLDWVQSLSQARRLAKRAGSRAVAEFRGTITTNLAGMACLGERYLNLQLPEIDSLAACVIEVNGKVTIDLASMTLTIPFILADTNIDAWDFLTEEGSPPLGMANNNGAALPLAVITGVAPIYGDVSGTTLSTRLDVMVAPVGRDDATFSLQWRRTGTTDTWTEQDYTSLDGTGAVTLISGVVPVGVSIDLQVSYTTGNGLFSGWSPTTPFAPPLNPGVLDFSQQSNLDLQPGLG